MQYKIISDLPSSNALPARIRIGSPSVTRDKTAAIRDALSAHTYISDVNVNSLTGSIALLYEAEKRSELLRAISTLDPSKLSAQICEDAPLEFRLKLYDRIAWHFAKKLFMPSWIRIPLYLWNAWKHVKCAVASLKAGKVGVDVLDGTAITASILRGDGNVASTLMFLLGLSELIEGYTRERAKSALAESLALNISTVWVRRDGQDVRISLAELIAGDNVIVRAGSIIPADGRVIDGEATVNQSSLTGEAVPVFKQKGDSVFAGTVLDEGELLIEARLTAGDSRISEIIRLIENSETLKADIHSRAERIADNLVPFNFMFALGAGVLGGARAALSVLLVDYSCALKLSTPIAVLSAMREASALGILVKGGRHLETAALADTVVFDKTGTLTLACPEVAHVGAFDGYEPDEILRTAACIEEHFSHSLAKAVVRKASELDLHHDEKHAQVSYIAAHGITTFYEGNRVIIGSRHFVEDDEKVLITPEQSAEINRVSGGESVLYLGVGTKLAGYICITDTLREESKEVISSLRRLGVKRIVMLTGDGENAARKNCEMLGIDEYRAQMLPKDKQAYIEEVKSLGHSVIMVGDGINDSPALAAADLSVAMSDSADLARETANVTLLGKDLYGIITLRLLGQLLLKRVKKNYCTIVGANSILLALGLGNVIPASALSFAHNAATTVVSATSTGKLLPDTGVQGVS